MPVLWFSDTIKSSVTKSKKGQIYNFKRFFRFQYDLNMEYICQYENIHAQNDTNS